MPPHRRKKEPGGRQKSYRVKVSEQEDQILMHKANEAGVTVSRFLIEASLGDPDDSVLRKGWRAQLEALRRQMKESGYSPEVQTQASELLRKLEG